MMKKNIFAILLIIVSIFLIGFGSVSFLNDDGKEKNPNENEKENPLGEEMNEEELETFRKLAVKSMFFARYFPITDVSSIPNQYLINLGIDGVDTSASDVEKAVFKVLGSQVKINHEDYMCSFDNEIYYDYDEETKTYLVAPSKTDIHSHVGSYDVPIKLNYVHVESGYKKDNEYILNTRIIYVCSTDPQVGDFYASYTDCTIDNPVPVVENPEGYIPNETYVDFAGDKLPVTTFTFYEEEGNYVLKSVVIQEKN